MLILGNAEVHVMESVWVVARVPGNPAAVTMERKSGRGAAEVARGRVRRVELTGGEATTEM